MYETWRFLKKLLENMTYNTTDDEEEDGDQVEEEDLDDIPAVDLVKMLRRLSLPDDKTGNIRLSAFRKQPTTANSGFERNTKGRHKFGTEKLTKKFIDQIQTKSQPRRGSLQETMWTIDERTRNKLKRNLSERDVLLPDLAKSQRKSREQTCRDASPDLVQGQPRKIFRVDSQCIRDASDKRRQDNKQENDPTTSFIGRRRWSCGNVDDIEEDGWHGMRFIEARNWSPLTEEEELDGKNHLSKNVDREYENLDVEHCSNVIDANQAPNWKGKSLSVVSEKHNNKACCLNVEDMHFQRLRLHSQGASANRDLHKRKKHFVDSIVAGPVSDVVVLAALAGAAYCVNKIRSIFF